jgi:hypothetical protein
MEHVKGLTMTRQQIEELAIAKGFKLAGPDHPVYKEAPTIVFVQRPAARPARPKSNLSMTPEEAEEMAKKLR